MKPERVRVAAYGLVVRDAKILLVRVSSGAPNAVGKWALPGGGLDFGEDPESGMVREVREETGLVVLPQGVAAVQAEVIDLRDERIHSVRLLYCASVVSGDLRHEPQGSTDMAAWFSLAEAMSLTLLPLARAGVELAFSER